MYFIEKEQDLIGKKIVFTHFARFADYMAIVTEDKGVFVFEKEDDGEVYIFRELQARKYILGSEYLRHSLNKLGIISKEDIKEYEDKIERDRKDYLYRVAKENEVREHREYLRLKEKFECKSEGC